MNRRISTLTLVLAGTLLLPASARAHVERIELDIAGYLCGF